MIFAIDIGNTNTVLALSEGQEWVDIWRIFSDQRKTSDEYFVTIDSLLRSRCHTIPQVDKVIISSVVPNLSTSFEKICCKLFGVKPLMISHDINLNINRDSIPVQLGSDLLCNICYAHERFPGRDVMVVDFGTALTFSTVSGDGDVLGVAIAPGLVTAVNALFGATAQLPQVQLKVPESALGRDSEDSIRSGIMFGYAGMVDSMIVRVEKEIGRKLTVIATGGLAKTISPEIERIDHIDKCHTLNGIRLLAQLN